MENKELSTQIEKLSKEVEAQRKELEAQRGVLILAIGLIEKLSNAVEDGFKKVNERMSALEGKRGSKE